MADAIRPFRINVPDEALVDLRRRIRATRWPERETVTDESQGVQLATMQELASYWAADYNWRNVEARLNALPQFMTEIDGVDGRSRPSSSASCSRTNIMAGPRGLFARFHAAFERSFEAMRHSSVPSQGGINCQFDAHSIWSLCCRPSGPTDPRLGNP